MQLTAPPLAASGVDRISEPGKVEALLPVVRVPWDLNWRGLFLAEAQWPTA